MKNWLIRTRSFDILGPISKKKIISLINSSSLHPMDEVCSGNGFWFFVKETEFVDKYILGDDEQGFSNLNDVKDVVSIENNRTKEGDNIIVPVKEDEENLYPSSEDLEYPDMDMPKRQKVS